MTHDLVIVGGGLAGAALALRLAPAGQRVVLVERSTGPHDKVCGEFLSREAVLHLNALGIDPRRLGGHPIGAVRVVAGRHTITRDLPFAALGLSRRRLDEALLSAAAAAGSTLRRGSRAVAINGSGGGQRVRLADGSQIEAARAVLATGKHGFRGFDRRGRQIDLVGFKQHVRLGPDQTRALAGHVELMLFPGGYAGLQLVEDDVANLCLLVRRSRLGALGHDWRRLLAMACAGATLLATRLADAVPLSPRPLSIAGLPYGHVGDGRGDLWCIGDQAAVIPSFTGDGMSLALHSAALAARGILAGEHPRLLGSAMRRDVGGQVSRATLLSQAGVRRPVQHALVALGALAPGLIPAAARATRLSDRALFSALG